MYTDIKLAVKLSDGITPFFRSLVGVRQGCNLSPLLFNIFVNDIFEQFDSDKCFSVNVQGKLINCLMYADDLLILSENEQGLSESLQRLGKYTEKWNLKISERKTKIMIFNKSGKTIRLNIKVNGILISSCTEYTYLGTVFTPGNTFKKNQVMLFKKACRALFGFLREINPALGAEPLVICKLFNSLVSPILLYNVEIWGGVF